MWLCLVETCQQVKQTVNKMSEVILKWSVWVEAADFLSLRFDYIHSSPGAAFVALGVEVQRGRAADASEQKSVIKINWWVQNGSGLVKELCRVSDDKRLFTALWEESLKASSGHLLYNIYCTF